MCMKLCTKFLFASNHPSGIHLATCDHTRDVYRGKTFPLSKDAPKKIPAGSSSGSRTSPTVRAHPDQHSVWLLAVFRAGLHFHSFLWVLC